MTGVITQAVTVLSARGIIRLAQFVTFVLLARFLTPEEFGWFGIITTALILAATLGSLGFRQSFAYQIGQKKMTPGEANGTAIVLWPLFTAVSAAVVVALYSQRVPSLSAPETILLIVVGVAGTMYLTLAQGTYLGRGRIRDFSITETMPRLALLLFVVILVGTGSITLSSALWAHVGGFCIALPVVAYLAWKGAGKLGTRFDLIGPMLGYGLVFAINLFLITLCTRVSIFIIEHHSGAELAGQFFAAARVNEIFLEAATAFGMVLFSNAARQTEPASILTRNARISCWLFWSFWALALTVIAIAPILVKVMLGPAYSSAGPALQILALGLAPAAAAKVIYPTLAGAGKPYFGTPVILASLTVNVSIALLLIPEYGLAGGAIALVCGQYLLFIGYVILCRYRYQIDIKNFLVPRRQDIVRISRKSLRLISKRFSRSPDAE